MVLATHRRLVVPVLGLRDSGVIELESPRDSSKAATEVATVVVVLNVPKLAEVLSPPPKLGANGEDCTAVASRAWVHAEVELGSHSRSNSK